MGQLKYGISITDEDVGIDSPIVFKGAFADSFRKAAECGYDGVELQIKNPSQKNVDELLELKEKYNLEVSAITTGMEYFGNGLCMISDDEENQRQAVERLKEHVSLAKKLDSRVLFGSMRGSLKAYEDHDRMLERLSDNLKKVLEEAEKQDVIVLFEAINLYVNNYILTMDEGAEFVDRIGSKNLVLMADTHHMCLDDKDHHGVLKKYAGRLGYVHYAEGNRHYPGGGNINFADCTLGLLEGGYEGWLTMEIIPYPDPMTAAKRAIGYCKGIESACRAILD